MSGQWLLDWPNNVGLSLRYSNRHRGLEAPFWHPLNLLSRLSVQTAPLYDRYPSFTDGKFFPALLPLTRQAEGQSMCAYVGVWVGADREGIHLPLLCPPRPIHLSFLHLFSVIYPLPLSPSLLKEVCPFDPCIRQ